jgi:putative hydrolase of the HAD superfamily
MIKGVIFDLGNTLLRQDNVEWEKFERAGLANHISIFEKRDRYKPNLKEWSGRFYNLRTAFEEIAEWHNVEVPIEKIFQIMLEFYEIPADIQASSLVQSFYQPLMGARRLRHDALEALQTLSRHHLRMGVVSNTSVPGRMAREMLERLQILKFFEFTFFSSEFVFRKPNPTMFEAALNRWGLKSSSVAHIGDQLDRDVAGAGALGIRTVWLNSDRGQLKKTKFKPNLEIASLNNLGDTLKELK